MSKLGAIGRGLYALIAFVVNIVLRVGLNVALIGGVAVSGYEAYKFARSSGVLQRKEGEKRQEGVVNVKKPLEKRDRLGHCELMGAGFCSSDLR